MFSLFFLFRLSLRPLLETDLERTFFRLFFWLKLHVFLPCFSLWFKGASDGLLLPTGNCKFVWILPVSVRCFWELLRRLVQLFSIISPRLLPLLLFLGDCDYDWLDLFDLRAFLPDVECDYGELACTMLGLKVHKPALCGRWKTEELLSWDTSSFDSNLLI